MTSLSETRLCYDDQKFQSQRFDKVGLFVTFKETISIHGQLDFNGVKIERELGLNAN